MSDHRDAHEIERSIARRREDLGEDLEELESRLSRDNLKAQAREQVDAAKDAAKEAARERLDAAKETAMGKVHEVQHRLSERAAAVRDEAGARAQAWGSAATEKVRRSPAVGALVGLGVGAAAILAARGLQGSAARSSGRQPTRRETLVAWLNDAHAMERAQIQVLKRHARDARDRPEAEARFEAHVQETRRHAELVAGCIERLGGKVSGAKSGAASVMGAAQGMSTGPAHDELVKNLLADYASEHFEIASYQALIVAARELGEAETVRVCREILADEEEMAGWLGDRIAETTRSYLAGLGPVTNRLA